MARQSRSTKAALAARHSSANITNFARVSKRTASGKLAIGKKELIEGIVAAKAKETAIAIPIPAPVPTTAAPTVTSRKRKAAVEPEAASTTTTTSSSSPRTTTSSAKRAPKRARHHHQQKQQQSAVDPSDAQQAGALLERLRLGSSPSSRSSSPLTACTALTTPCESDNETDATTLPAEVADLQRLHACLLKTLSLHYAHNGAHAPVDVQAICPSVAQAWGKRKVVVDDIQLCIGVHDMTKAAAAAPRSIFDTAATASSSTAGGSPFSLCDYGRGKICIERAAAAAAPLPSEEKLNRLFETNLGAAWRAAARSPVSTATTASFISSLPRAPIAKSTSALRASALLANRQRALDDLKSSLAKKPATTTTAVEEKKKTTAAAAAAAAGGMSLLDRIRHRQQQQTEAEATAPSPEALARRSALARAADVAAVVAMLSTAAAAGQKRVSFPLSAVLAKLRDSLRLPLSREEGAACVRLLAVEIAPEWLRVVTVAGRENVVVLTDFTPSKAVVEDRVRAAASASR